MKAGFAAVVLATSVALAIVAPTRAFAKLDPDNAEADTRAVLQASDYTFCTKPAEPLSERARDLCPLAGEIPGCSAFVTACEKVVVPEAPPSELWMKVVAFLARFAPVVAWLIVGALGLFVIYLVVRAVRAGREESLPVESRARHQVAPLEDPKAPDEPRAALELLRRAAAARARGDGRAALFAYLAAALRALDDRGAIRIARDRTNGEYVRGCQEASARPTLRELVRDVDGVEFGGGIATEEVVAATASRAETLVRGFESLPPRLGTLMTLGVMILLGACHGSLGGGHDDPAGRDLLADLLTRQGAEVASLPGSLANLPLEGAPGPVLILDAERVPLEEKTRDHVVAWVKRGGVLVIAGGPALWPKAFWAKRTGDYAGRALVSVLVETRDAPASNEDDEDAPRRKPAPAKARHARIAQASAMTWPSEDRAPRAIAHLESGDLYGAIRSFGEGRVLGLASADLLSNAGLALPGNAAALVAMLAALDRHEFAIARSEQGIAPPDNPLAGLVRIGLGPALVHVAFFIPLLFLAYGVRQAAPRAEPPPERRSFVEHVEAVGSLYTRRRSSTHALAVYARHVDDRLRATMPRGSEPAPLLAARSGADAGLAADTYARALAASSDEKPKGDELAVLQRLSLLYAKSVSRK